MDTIKNITETKSDLDHDLIGTCYSCGTTNSCDSGSVHCAKCYITHAKDIVTLINYVDEKFVVLTFDADHVSDAEDLIKEYSVDEPIAILDLHNVADTTEQDTDYGVPSTIVSFVGKHSSNRYGAIEDIRARILSKQILFGALVFKRGKRKKKKYLPTQVDGSKAWFCSIIPSAKLFIDDADDHVESVENLDNGIKAVLFNPSTIKKYPLPYVIKQNL